MDYEKMYKEALERAKKFEEKYGGGYAGHIFPELAESEDEKVRKELVALFKEMQDSAWHEKYWHGLLIDSILSWLEKQKEEEGYEAIPVESTLEYKLGVKAGRDSEKQKEQKQESLTKDESNPKIEAMADLERTFESNPEKLPGWLKEALAEKYQKGYYKGRQEALEEYNKSVIYHYNTRPLCWEPGGTCTNPHMDCINCPRHTTGGMTSTSTSSGTSTLKADEE